MNVNAVLWKVGPTFTKKFGDGAGDTARTWVFKELDTNKEFKMNMPDKFGRKQDWEKYATEGNIFYGMTPLEQYPNRINFYEGFTKVTRKGKQNASI